MNKHHQFWIRRWQQKDIPFHQQQVNSDLPKYWSQLALKPSSTVLVPLCGKSLDMVWLREKGHYVIGIELSTIAIEQFFETINEPFQTKQINGFSVFTNNQYEIWSGDIFQMNKKLFKPINAVYDRGSLIALPNTKRQQYVSHISYWLKDNGKILLKTAVYNQEEMQGPPYSVPEQEVLQLYQQFSNIQRVKSNPRPPADMQRYLERGCKTFIDETWIITK